MEQVAYTVHAKFLSKSKTTIKIDWTRTKGVGLHYKIFVYIFTQSNSLIHLERLQYCWCETSCLFCTYLMLVKLQSHSNDSNTNLDSFREYIYHSFVNYHSNLYAHDTFHSYTALCICCVTTNGNSTLARIFPNFQKTTSDNFWTCLARDHS